MQREVSFLQLRMRISSRDLRVTLRQVRLAAVPRWCLDWAWFRPESQHQPALQKLLLPRRFSGTARSRRRLWRGWRPALAASLSSCMLQTRWWPPCRVGGSDRPSNPPHPDTNAHPARCAVAARPNSGLCMQLACFFHHSNLLNPRWRKRSPCPAWCLMGSHWLVL